MTTTLVPPTGAGVAFTQQGQGTTPGYSALDLRRSDSLGLQEGVYNSTDFMVQQRIAGANMQVEVTMTSGGFATVQGDTIAGQGLYTVPVHSANILETIGNADPTNPRVDQIILEVLDNVHDVSGGNRAQTRVLTGTATVGATLANRTGAAALPSSALLLADVLVGAAAASITNAVIRDRRKWARGLEASIETTTADYTTTSGTLGNVDASNLTPRVECSGVLVVLTLDGVGSNDVSAAFLSLQPFMDGAGFGRNPLVYAPAASANVGWTFQWRTTPAAGSHTFGMNFAQLGGGTARIRSSSSNPLRLTVEEIPRQNSKNNATTTG